MSFNNTIELSHTIELDEGQVAIVNPPQSFNVGAEVTISLESSDGNFAVVGTVVATPSFELSHTIEMSDGNINVINPPQSFTGGRWIRAFALPKIPGDDAQEITLDDIIAIRAKIYPDSKGNPSDYKIAGYHFSQTEAERIFRIFKGGL